MSVRLAWTGAFPAMTTTIRLTGVGIDSDVHATAMRDTREEVAAWERRFSRFRPDSMLSRVNTANGVWIEVNDVFLGLVEAAREGVIATRGVFDPAILPILEAQGYRHTIEEMDGVVATIPSPAGIVTGIDAWERVELDRRGMRLRLPIGMRIDLGGIAKGALADRLADRFAAWPGGMVSIGGDLRVWGTPPSGDTWRAGIEDPRAPDTDLLTVDLIDDRWRALATSSRAKRQWTTTDGHAHHLIDPRTGASVRSPLLAVTACATTAVAAEVATKSLMVGSGSREVTAGELVDAWWAITVDTNGHTRFIARERI